jgi:hypothetical protein
MPAALNVRFQRFQPDNEREVAELRRQRTVSTCRSLTFISDGRTDSDNAQLCGWGLEDVEKWRGFCRSGTRVRDLSLRSHTTTDCAVHEQEMFWIFYEDGVDFELPELEVLNLDNSRYGPPPPDASFRPIGHVALVRPYARLA